ncbi:HAMP domain-containing histidine kinase [Chroococcidiopsis sp. FACHB-1243]|uniref:sensor histidine kinase n=1 Tax=Chroococcidiopsis sp. [FACHB-1243] TaxID=2692781 RepID=UPI0017805655|nr:HAMP domain-containing sensor histidine kinase [Chroococcidiopsis sp. [FACHB-1243]]MBD2308015.1 HAMP domain-containing histidine kinase [Chroococcidiopsis sp. [FACHB-1243]]
MSWNEWVYLLFGLFLGLGLGLGGRWWLDKSKRSLTANNANDPTPEQKPLTADRNEILALQSQLQQSQIAYQLARKMCQFKAGFLTRTAHELRSPLNSLIGLHQLILSDLCDDPAEERTFIAQAHQSALKLMNLMDRAIDVSRLEHGSSQLEIQPINLAALLTDVYNSTYLIAANRNLRLQLSLPETETYVLADPRWLRQVAIDLLDICLTQMQEGTIFVSTNSDLATNEMAVCIDTELPHRIWSDSIDVSQSDRLSPLETKDFAFSPGMILLLTQTLLDLMHCRLEILSMSNSTSTDEENESYTRLQLMIPLVTLEPETVSEATEN